MKNSNLIIFAGLPGTGKSTACRIFVDKLKNLNRDIFFFDVDQLAKDTKFFSDINPDDQREFYARRKEFYNLQSERLKELLMAHQFVVMDAVFEKRELRKIIYSGARDTNAIINIIMTVCPKDIVEKRILADINHKLGNPQKRLFIYQQTEKHLQSINLFEKYSNKLHIRHISTDINTDEQIQELITDEFLFQS